jgi:hypothetical protein
MKMIPKKFLKEGADLIGKVLELRRLDFGCIQFPL